MKINWGFIITIVILFVLAKKFLPDSFWNLLGDDEDPPPDDIQVTDYTEPNTTTSNPNSGSNGSTGGGGNFNAKHYADRVFNDIDGISWSAFFGGGGRDMAVYEEILTLSNAQLILIANQYKNDYYSRHQESIVQAIEGETWTGVLGGGQRAIIDQLLSRFKALGV